MYTLTILKGQYMGYDVFIPIIEKAIDNFEITNFVIEEIDGNSGLQLVRKPLWQYLHDDKDLQNFMRNYFQQSEGRVLHKISCLLKDHTHPKIISTPYGDIVLPTEQPFNLYAIVKDNINPFLSPEDAVLPVLIFNKN
jgi:hypothetical protein